MIDGIPNWPLYFLPKNTIDHRSPHFVCFHWDLRHAADMEIEILQGYPGFSEHIISPCICQIWVNTTASLKFSLYRWSFTHNKTVQKCYWLVVWYVFRLSNILGIIIPTDFHIFIRFETTKQVLVRTCQTYWEPPHAKTCLWGAMPSPTCSISREIWGADGWHRKVLVSWRQTDW